MELRTLVALRGGCVCMRAPAACWIVRVHWSCAMGRGRTCRNTGASTGITCIGVRVFRASRKVGATSGTWRNVVERRWAQRECSSKDMLPGTKCLCVALGPCVLVGHMSMSAARVASGHPGQRDQTARHMPGQSSCIARKLRHVMLMHATCPLALGVEVSGARQTLIGPSVKMALVEHPKFKAKACMPKVGGLASGCGDSVGCGDLVGCGDSMGA